MFMYYLLSLSLLLTQLDNQLAGAVFSTVLAPVPPPKTVAAESGQCLLILIVFIVSSLMYGVRFPLLMTLLFQLCNFVFHSVFMLLLYLLLPSAPKPFAEMSVMIRKSEHSDINQIKYVLLTYFWFYSIVVFRFIDLLFYNVFLLTVMR